MEKVKLLNLTFSFSRLQYFLADYLHTRARVTLERVSFSKPFNFLILGKQLADGRLREVGETA